MKVYKFNENNILDENSLSAALQIDPTFFIVKENEVVADQALPKKTKDEIYFVDTAKRDKDNRLYVSSSVSTVENMKGKTVYLKESGEAIICTEPVFNADLYEKSKPPFDYAYFKNGEWIEDVERKNEHLTELKLEKLKEASEKSQDIIAEYAELEIVPAFEKDTWTIQANEAAAFFKDNTSPTPVLDIIANQRGVDRLILIEKAHEKARMLASFSGLIAGQRQAIEDRVKVVMTIEELEAIEVVFTLPNLEELKIKLGGA